MRVVSAIVLIAGGLTSTAAAFQAAGRQGTAAPAGACALLTRDLLEAHTPTTKERLMLSTIPAEAHTIGATGSACSWGDVIFQLDPFPFSNFDKIFGKWTPVSGVGDRAYFRDNRGEYAELAVAAGGRMITIQMDVPAGRTTASVQPNAVALAKAILARLK